MCDRTVIFGIGWSRWIIENLKFDSIENTMPAAVANNCSYQKYETAYN